MTARIGFGLFVGIDESDAPDLLQRMSSRDLAMDSERYGIVSRLIATPGTEVADLTVVALEKLLAQSRLAPSDLGAMVLSSRIVNPAEAAQQAADRMRLTCPARGIERACSGFPAATKVAIDESRRTQQPVAVIAAEIISRNINWEQAQGDLTDQHRARGQAAKLFGDGAAAALLGPLSPATPHEILDCWQDEIPDEKQLIQKTDVEDSVDPWGKVRAGVTTCMSMPGRRGFWLVKRAPQVMADASRNSLTRMADLNQIRNEPLAHVVPHQANGLIVSRLQKLFDEADSHTHVWNCIESTGNTVSASIPLAMTSVQHQIPDQALVALPSVGAGGPGYRPDVLSHGCILLRMGATPDRRRDG